jgi:hypothetical protein
VQRFSTFHYNAYWYNAFIKLVSGIRQHISNWYALWNFYILCRIIIIIIIITIIIIIIIIIIITIPCGKLYCI